MKRNKYSNKYKNTQSQKQTHLPSSEASSFDSDVSQKKQRLFTGELREVDLVQQWKKGNTALEPLD